MNQAPETANAAAMKIRATLRGLLDENPGQVEDTLAGALAEIVNRHISAYGPERAATICDKATALARSAPAR